MAITMVGVDLEAALGVESSVLEHPQNAYLAPSRSSEHVHTIQLAELPQMASGMRNRHPTGRSLTPPATNEVAKEPQQGTTGSSEGGRQDPGVCRNIEPY